MVQQYRMLENQVPGDCASSAASDEPGPESRRPRPRSLQNPLPQANTLTGILDGSRTDGRASEFLARNRVL